MSFRLISARSSIELPITTALPQLTVNQTPTLRINITNRTYPALHIFAYPLVAGKITYMRKLIPSIQVHDKNALRRKGGQVLTYKEQCMHTAKLSIQPYTSNMWTKKTSQKTEEQR